MQVPVLNDEKEAHRGASRNHSHIWRCNVDSEHQVEHVGVVARKPAVEPPTIVAAPAQLAGLESAPARSSPAVVPDLHFQPVFPRCSRSVVAGSYPRPQRYSTIRGNTLPVAQVIN